MLLETPPRSATLHDEKAILQTLTRLSSAWVRGDAAAVSAQFDPACDHRMLTGGGRMRRGRAEFERVFTQAFAARAAREGRSLRFSLAGLRCISPDVALLDATLYFGPGRDRAGRPTAGGAEPFTAVMKKDNGAWLIAACRVGAFTPE